MKSTLANLRTLNSIVFAGISIAFVFSCSNSTPLTPTPNVKETVKVETMVQVENVAAKDGFVSISLTDTTTARYLIRERLARLELPNDAVGETKEVTGNILFNSQGSVQNSSQFTVNVKSLVSDESRRDRYVRNNTLKTGMYPEVYFKLLEVKDLGWPIPSEGSHQFSLIGDITIMDVTRSITWDAEVIFSEQSLTGVARATILFEDFAITKPSLSFILSVADEIRLELDLSASILR